jgi:DNA-binding protein HU-beta
MKVIEKGVFEVNKTELIDRVAEKTGKTKKESGMVVDTVLRIISDALKGGEKVVLVGFGNFEVRERAARLGRNPQTGEEIQIEASRVPSFRAGKQLKELVNQ